MGFFDLLSGVSDAVSAARLFLRALAIEREARPQFAAALPFLGCHPLVGFQATETEDVRSKPLLSLSNRATEATSLPSPALQRIRAICA